MYRAFQKLNKFHVLARELSIVWERGRGKEEEEETRKSTSLLPASIINPPSSVRQRSTTSEIEKKI